MLARLGAGARCWQDSRLGARKFVTIIRSASAGQVYLRSSVEFPAHLSYQSRMGGWVNRHCRYFSVRSCHHLTCDQSEENIHLCLSLAVQPRAFLPLSRVQTRVLLLTIGIFWKSEAGLSAGRHQLIPTSPRRGGNCE